MGISLVVAAVPPNPTLVDAKRKELKQKQQDWEKYNTAENSSTLN